jgi:Peptidase family M1 domain/PEGA domain
MPLPKRLGIITFLFLFASLLSAVPVSITVKDTSGAVITNAEVAVIPVSGGPPVANVQDIPPGRYKVTASKPGFAAAEVEIEVKAGDPLSISIELKIAAQQTAVEVSGKLSSLANSDPNYRALRTGRPAGVWRVENLELNRDIGKFTFRAGEFSFLPPVLGKTVMAVFIGDGSFQLAPRNPIESNHLKLITGSSAVDEQFRSVVLCFTDGTESEIKKAAVAVDEASKAGPAFQEFRSRVRARSDSPRSLLENFLGLENVPNIDADLLAELYAPQRHSFSAYIHGAKHADLRFLVSDSGALPSILSPEEVALLNDDAGTAQDGIWYLSHTAAEWDKHTASSKENRKWVLPERYRIETVIGSNEHLTASCEVAIKVLVEGTRVIKFGLLPALRVSAVRLGAQEIPFIQEAQKEDGSFYVVLPSGATAGSEVSLTIEYAGDKVVNNAGGGTFAIGARESWFPSLNALSDRATFDLTFKVPKHYLLVSVGKLDKSWTEENAAATHWVSEIPLAVAGFNYGEFTKKERRDDPTGYLIEAYATKEVPEYLRAASRAINLTPLAMAQSAIVDAQNSIRVFDHFFGGIPYGRIAITQQPQFNFGQSWPSLVYLPISAFLDSTQRWALMGQNAFRFADFVDEVIPHEVSHQWWGHAVGWATYHDQWLSEGFADFSAGLFLQNTGRAPEYLKYLERQRLRVIEKNAFGMRPNDAGPLWLGLLLDTYRTPRAYNDVTYAKGGLVLHMLRQMMWDPQTQDQEFIALMHEFVSTDFNQAASTEQFLLLVNKHMKPAMDLAGDHTMTWFFADWVYGNELPKYRLDYSVQPAPEGKFLLTGKLTQSDVSAAFRMRVPIYIEVNKETVRIGSVAVSGSRTEEFKVVLPEKPKKVMANALNDVLALETANEQR